MKNRQYLKTLLACVAAAGLAACDVDVEKEGRLPSVDVDAGEAPEIKVRGPEVDVGTQETTVTVPDVDVDTKEKKITVPDIDVDLPKENDPPKTDKPD